MIVIREDRSNERSGMSGTQVFPHSADSQTLLSDNRDIRSKREKGAGRKGAGERDVRDVLQSAISGGGGDGAQNRGRRGGEEVERVVRAAGRLWRRLRTWSCALSLFGLLLVFLPVAAASVGSCVRRWVASCNTHKPSPSFSQIILFISQNCFLM